MRENVMYVPTPLGVLKVETHPDAAHPAVWVKFIPAGDPSSREQFVSSTVFLMVTLLRKDTPAIYRPGRCHESRSSLESF